MRDIPCWVGATCRWMTLCSPHLLAGRAPPSGRFSWPACSSIARSMPDLRSRSRSTSFDGRSRQHCAPSRKGKTVISRHSRRARLSTRGCCGRINCRGSISICVIRIWQAQLPWFTRDSRPTRSRRGDWRIPIGSSATTGRSTRCAAI